MGNKFKENKQLRHGRWERGTWKTPGYGDKRGVKDAHSGLEVVRMYACIKTVATTASGAEKPCIK